MNVRAIDKKRLVIVGATGMVGGYALRYALEHPAIGCATSIGRRELGISHPKMHEVVHQDFANCSVLAPALTDQDAAIFCLGTYTGTVPDAQLRAITVDYTTESARVLRSSRPDAAFSFLSGSGADPTGRSRMAFARYKGEAEKVIRADDLARAMVDVVVGGMGVAPRMVFENRDIRALIQPLDPQRGAAAKGRK